MFYITKHPTIERAENTSEGDGNTDVHLTIFMTDMMHRK